MADPRLATQTLEGINPEGETFSYDNSIVYSATASGGSVSVGLAVKMTGDFTVGLATDASSVLGKLLSVESDGRCTVQTEGVCTLPGGTGAALTAGSRVVGAALSGAPGYIRNVAAATLAEVAVASGKIRSAAVSTAVEVNFPA